MMNLRSLLQDILGEVSSKIISFQMELHQLIILVKSSDCFRIIESLGHASRHPKGLKNAKQFF